MQKDFLNSTISGCESAPPPVSGEDRQELVLARQLENIRAAGSYTLQCDRGLLKSAVGAAGFVLFEAELKGVKGKQNFIHGLALAAGVPPEFGENWDALADALCDLSWKAASGYVLLLDNASDTLGLSINDREIAQDILADTVLYWRQRGKAFWILFS